MRDPFDLAAGWLQEHVLLPLLYHLGWMRWEDMSYGWALFAVYGALQVAVMYAICVPLERWRPVERWPNQKAVGVDVLYTVISRVGILPLFTFVLFYQAQLALNGWLADHGWVPPMLEIVFPLLLGHPVVTFVLYAIILDFADYWRHRISHRLGWWWALHSLHHAQRQMTFWSDDRNHLLDDIIGAVWFGAIALLIGVPPLQFPLLVLVLRFIESLSHANVRLSYGWLGERLIVSPRFHRAHHGVLAAGQRSCNYGAVFPWWDMLFGTADFTRDYAPTGDPSGEDALASGSYLRQQWAGARRFAGVMARRHPSPGPTLSLTGERLPRT
jgi:sterol desaturase/sphingolipid hydroxylase (fatty acid hydroxylase superfamily)